MRLPARVRRFIDEKFPEDPLFRWLVALAIIVGPVIYLLNWYISFRIWWDLLK